MTSRSCVKVLGFGSLLELRTLTQESFVRPKGVWTLSTLKSSLLSLITAISFHLFGLHLLIACKGPSGMTPVRKRAICRPAAT